MTIQHANPHIVPNWEFKSCRCTCPACLRGPGWCVCVICSDDEHDHTYRDRVLQPARKKLIHVQQRREEEG